jgi:hypothetical protein
MESQCWIVVWSRRDQWEIPARSDIKALWRRGRRRKREICPSVLSTYLTLRFQSSTQGSVDVQLEFRFHLALTVGHLASIAAGIATVGWPMRNQSPPVVIRLPSVTRATAAPFEGFTVNHL